MPTDYPPAFCESCVSGTIGQINDLAGPEYPSPPPPPPASPSDAGSLSVKRGAEGDPIYHSAVPVVITGTRPPSFNRFPGLRESMLGSAIVQLAEQIPDDNRNIREDIIKLAEKLHRAGADKILRNTISRKTPVPLKKRSKT